MGQTFFIADQHFGGKNILSYDNRPFASVEENDAELIRRWNLAVSPEDTVWILGDLSQHNVTKTIQILDSLCGIKNLCVGNHDKRYLRNPDFRSRFAEITSYKEIEFPDGSGVVLCHYPIPCFKDHYYGWAHLYGHTHLSFEENIMRRVRYEIETLYDKPCKMRNVGAMMPYMDYTPRTLTEIFSSF